MNELAPNDVTTSVPALDELAILKDRARMIGLTFSNNIGVQALRQKIDEKLKASEPDEAVESTEQNPLEDGDGPKPLTLRERLVQEQMKLIRVRITNLNPNKKELSGEIFTVANEYIGTVRKYVPFNEASDGGYHLPYCLYTMMKERKFLHIRVNKGADGREKVITRWAQEFAFEILPQLTDKELKKLGAAQLAAGVIVSDEDALL
jgi:hypothetical protein